MFKRKKAAIVTNPLVFAYADKNFDITRMLCLGTDEEEEWWKKSKTNKVVSSVNISNRNFFTKLSSALTIFYFVACNDIILAPQSNSLLLTLGLMMVSKKALRTYEGSRRSLSNSKRYLNSITLEDMRNVNVAPNLTEFKELVEIENRIFIGQPWEELVLDNNDDQFIRKSYRQIVQSFSPTIYLLHPKERIKSWLPLNLQIRLDVPFESAIGPIKQLLGGKSTKWGAVDSNAILALPEKCSLHLYMFNFSRRSEQSMFQEALANECREKGHNLVIEEIENFQ